MLERVVAGESLSRPFTDLERVFIAHRADLLRLLRSRNVGAAAEDLLHDLWLRLPKSERDMQSPLAYLYRMANNLANDLLRTRSQAAHRDAAWHAAVSSGPADVCERPLPDRAIAARHLATRILQALEHEGSRVASIFRRHRIDGLTQREIAAELGVSIGTVERDLRRAYGVIVRFHGEADEG